MNVNAKSGSGSIDAWESNPSNPQAWTMLKKLSHVVPVGALILSVTMGSSTISPAASQVEEAFGVSRVAAILPFSLFTLGFAWGPAIAAPLSETFGRSALTSTFAGLLVYRTIAGMVGGPCVSIAGGTAADLFPEHLLADTLSTLMASGFLGSALGPVVGGFCAYYQGWRWTQWAALIVAGISFLLAVPMQETYKNVILKRQATANCANVETHDDTVGSFVKHIVTAVLMRAIHMLFTEPIVSAFALYNSFALGTLYGFFSAYPVILKSVYGFNVWQTGLTFLGTCVGVILGGMAAVVIQHTIYAPKWKRSSGGRLEPEQRLYVAMLGSVCIPVGLFWFAWTAHPSIHWISPTLAGVPFALGNLCLFITAALYLVDCYGPVYGASALASNGLARYTIAAVFPLFSTQMFERLGVAWATSLLGFVSLALLPIPWVFYKYGPKIRARSFYSVNDAQCDIFQTTKDDIS